MTPKETHTKYVNDLVALSDESGKSITTKARAHFGKMFEKARGNPDAFLKLLKISREVIIPMAAHGAKESIAKARTLGKGFANAS